MRWRFKSGYLGLRCAQWSCASCTLFSPKRRWPAFKASWIFAGGWRLLTAMRLISDVSRFHCFAVFVILARMAVMFSEIMEGGYESVAR